MAVTAETGQSSAMHAPGTERLHCVIIGAGPAGLAAGSMLKRRGLEAVLLERGDGAGAKWARRYDCLRINTSSLTSHLPGRRFPLSYGRWPTRDQLVAYYRRYAADNQLDIRTQVEVQAVERAGGDWAVETSRGGFLARNVIVATGKDGAPRIPDWPGHETFAGEISHSSEYANAERYRARRVLVVGAGSSALDICIDLHDGGAAAVWLCIRTPPHIVRRAVGPVPADLVAITAWTILPEATFNRVAGFIRKHTIGDLGEYGLHYPTDDFTDRVLKRGMIPTIDPGRFVPTVRKGHIKIVPPITRLHGQTVQVEGGRELEVDAIIAGTGYGRGLDELVGHLGVLDDRGHPRAHGPEDLREAPGLYFVGFSDVLTGNLREIRLVAKELAKHVARRTRSARPGSDPLSSSSVKLSTSPQSSHGLAALQESRRRRV